MLVFKDEESKRKPVSHHQTARRSGSQEIRAFSFFWKACEAPLSSLLQTHMGLTKVTPDIPQSENCGDKLSYGRILAERIFRGFLCLGRRVSSRIFSPDFFSHHFCGEKCPEKSSRKIPGKSLQNLYNKNPRHISAEGPGQIIMWIRRKIGRIIGRNCLRIIVLRLPCRMTHQNSSPCLVAEMSEFHPRELLGFGGPNKGDSCVRIHTRRSCSKKGSMLP